MTDVEPETTTMSGTDVLLEELRKDPTTKDHIEAVSNLLEEPPSRRELIDITYHQAQMTIAISNVLVALASKQGDRIIQSLDDLLPQMTSQIEAIGRLLTPTVFRAIDLARENADVR